MPTHVDVPGQGVIEFPDGMDDAAIADAIKTKILPQSAPQVSISSQSKPAVVPWGQSEGDNGYYTKGQPSMVPQQQAPLPTGMGFTAASTVGQTLGDVPAMALQGLAMHPPALPQPMTPAEGVHNAAIGLGGMAFNPVNALIPPAYGLVSKLSPLLAKTGLAALATPMVAQAAGVLSPGSGATVPQQVQAAITGGAGALGFLPFAAKDAPIPQEVNPRAVSPTPIVNPLAGQQAYDFAKRTGTLTPSPVETGGNLNSPNAFDKGVVMKPQPEVTVPPSAPVPQPPVKEMPPAPAPLSDYQQYQAVQQQMMSHEFGSPEFVDAWKQNEVIKNRNGGMPPKADAVPVQESSEPSQPMLPQQSSAATVPAPTVAAPASVTFKPAVRVGTEIVEGQHGAAAQTAYMRAQQRGETSPRVERGFVGSDNQWYDSPMAVSRKIQEQQNANVNKQQQGNVQRSADNAAGGQTGNVGREEVPSVQAGETVPSVREEENGQAYGALSEKEPGQQSGNAAANESVSNVQQQSVKKGLTSAEKDEEQRRLNAAVNSESGFTLIPKTIWDKVGFQGTAKVDPQQMFNRLRNVLGEGSDTWKWMQGAGLQGFLSTARTPDEVKQWAQENQPKVEVRKFGEGSQHPIQREYSQLSHSFFDNLTQQEKSKFYNYNDGYTTETDLAKSGWGEGRIAQAKRYKEIMADPNFIKGEQGKSANWQSIAPKAERDMPGYTEIAVVKPRERFPKGERIEGLGNNEYQEDEKGNLYALKPNQFPSSHSFPPNTLGFARGYMENVGGKKVFHVIEVQSDWAQRHREDMNNFRDVKTPNVNETPEQVKRLQDDWDKSHGDPLLPHYERLALKAAIEHARSEGATHVAVSDAETAMMTEGHDRVPVRPDTTEVVYQSNDKELVAFRANKLQNENPNNSYIVSNDGRQVLRVLDTIKNTEPEQAAGMRLHYDQTLPKIMSELTGSKGERVEMGEHKMAYMNGDLEIVPREKPRKDLIFRNPDSTPKTSITGQMFEIGKKNPTPEFSHFGKDKGEAGSILGPHEIWKAVSDETKQRFGNLKNKGKTIADMVMDTSTWKAKVLQKQGYDLSQIEARSPELANSVARYANSATASLLKGQVALNEVLGKNVKNEQFRKQLGGVIYEDMRQADGAKGNSVLDLKNSPFADKAQLDAAKKNPDIIAALDKWKELIQKPATEMHQKLNGGMAAAGKETGTFANLIAVMGDAPDKEQVQSSPQVGPLSTMKKGSAFSRERQFSGQEYNLDAADMGLRMMTKNDAEFQKRNVYDQLEKSGLGKMLKPGEEVPAGMVKKQNPVTLRSIVTKNPDGTIDTASVSRYPAWDKRIDSQMEQALQLSTPFKDQVAKAAPLLHELGQLAIKTQVALGIDLGFHTANDMIAVLGSGKGFLKIPQKALSAVKAVSDIVTKDEGLTKELAKAAEQGVTFRGQSLGGWSSKLLGHIDTVTRVVLNREYDDLVKEGTAVDSPAERRRYVNSRAGQYNKRFMTYFQQGMQETGLGAFNVAGRNFNRLSVGAITASPGVKATSTADALRLRISVAAGLATAVLVLPAALNIATTGQAVPPGFEYGEIAIPGTKQPDGTQKKLNMRKWTLIDRAGRVTGLGPVLEQQIMPRLRGQQPASLKATAVASAKGIGQSLVQPFAGPPLNVASTLMTGKTATGFEQRTPGEKGPPYLGAAVSALNPLVGPFVNANASNAKTPMGKVADRLGSVVGVSNSKTPLQTMYAQASRFKQAHGISDDPSSYAPSEYIPLKKALIQGDVDAAKVAYQQLVDVKAKQYFTQDDATAQKTAAKVVQQEFSKLENFRFINKQDEPTFRASLTSEQRTTYDAAIAQQKAIADTFFSKVATKIETPKKGMFNIGGVGGIKGIKGF